MSQEQLKSLKEHEERARLEKRNERDRAKRKAETEEERKKRLEKRNERDRAKRREESVEEKKIDSLQMAMYIRHDVDHYDVITSIR